jgi:hypothetical protein
LVPAPRNTTGTPNSRQPHREGMERKQYLAILLTVLMLGSSVAYAVALF